MAFTKGKSGNPEGKPKGTQHKRTVEQLKRVEMVLSKLDETIEEDIEAMDPKERARMWQDLQEYIRPKLSRAELTGKDGEDLNVTFTETIITKKV